MRIDRTKLASLRRQGLRGGQPKSPYWRVRIAAEELKIRVLELEGELRGKADQEDLDAVLAYAKGLERRLKEEREEHERELTELRRKEKSIRRTAHAGLLDRIGELQQDLQEARRKLRANGSG